MATEPVAVSSIRLQATQESPRTARRFLREEFGTVDVDGVGAIAELLISELVSNVVRHVGLPMTVRVTRSGSVMRVEVDDESHDVPVCTHPDGETQQGRGLLLVDALATDWGCIARDTGKTVWFALDVRRVSVADPSPRRVA
jgi:anti-sigma regulatory factor (Ser/Thr protein kinase)